MPIDPSIRPFPGLRPFEADEQDLFFGREGQSEEILARLREHRFVAVVGASGSGKSSLIRAGLLPYLHGGFLAGAGSHWRIAMFRPGGDPIKNLATALDDPAVIGRKQQLAIAGASGEDDQSEEEAAAAAATPSALLLEVSLRRSGLGLIEAVRLARLPADEQVLIVVDQFEELFRFAEAGDRPGHDDDAAAFVKLLLEASRQRELPIYVVLTMRSDYIGDCARYRGLPEAATDGLYLIPRMTRDQRRAAIVEPIRVGGGTISQRLVVRLLNDVGDDPDQLPILQHALMRTWDYWLAHDADERPIDADDYVAIGTMSDALSQHADEAYEGLPDERYRTIAKRVFQALSEKGADSRETRRPTALGKLAQVVDAPIADVIRVLDDFRAPGRSFVMPAHGVPLDANSVIDISHESLIRGWRRMRQWVDQEAELARIYRRLAETASLYAEGTAGLLHDPDLAHLLTWRSSVAPNAAWGQRYAPGFEQAMGFLDQSLQAREAERRQRQSARRRLQFASSAATAVIAIVAVVALFEWHQANVETGHAQQQEAEALKQKTAAEEARKAADQEREREQHTITMATTIAKGLVFDLGLDSRAKVLPKDLFDGLFDSAIKLFTQVIETNPSSDAYQGRGVAYRALAKLDEAIGDFDHAIELDPTNAAAYNSRGNAYSDKRDYDRALADYDQAIKLNPQYTIAYNNRGLAYSNKGEYDKAIVDYTEAIRQNPKYVDAFNNRGNAYSDKHDYDRAIADYSSAIKLDPNYSLAYNNRGLAYYDKEDYDRAILDFNQAVKLDPRYAAAFNNRANAYRLKNNLDQAIADYSAAIAINPRYAIAYNNRGYTYRLKGNLDHAISDYTEAIKSDPKYALAYNNRGYAYRLKGNLDQAIADFTAAIGINPKYALAYDNRGDVYRAKGEYDKAIADYTSAIELDPKYTAAYIDRGNVYYDKGDYDSAIADYTAALKIDPKYALAYKNRGDGYRAKGDYSKAMADYNQAIALDPKFVDAYMGRGNAYYDVNDYDHAIADYTTAVTINPKYAPAYNNRGNAYRAKGNLDQAIVDYTTAIQNDPKYALAFNNRGQAYRLKGDLDHAIADYNTAIKLNPQYSDAYNNRGNIYYDKAQYDLALADYNQAIKFDPKFLIAYNNRGKTYRLLGDLDHAIADFSSAITLSPTYAIAYHNRGNAYFDKLDFDLAIADYNEALTIDPKDGSSYFTRGLVSIYVGDLPKAISDLEQSITLDPSFAYTPLWLDLADKRSNRPSRLKQTAAHFDMRRWPAPIIRLYLGELNPAQVLAAADNPNTRTKRAQVCEANFYIGELARLQNDKDQAARLFRLAVADCPRDFIERPAAKAELKALGTAAE